MTVVSFTTAVRPTTPGSAPYLVVHSSSESRATGPMPRAASADTKSRPSSGVAPINVRSPGEMREPPTERG
jgi:hypothetical protein